MKQYEKKLDAQGRPYLETHLEGLMLTRLPLLNKGTSFSLEERREFGLLGLMPTHVSSLDEQLERSYANFRSLRSDLDKHVFLRALQDRNSVLFYAFVSRHLAELLPIVYTPTVGLACEQWSRIYRRERGLFLS